MPIINMTVGHLTKEQKKDLIQSFTEVSMRVTGAPEAAHTIVIQEFDDDAMGLGKESVEEFKKRTAK